MCNMTSHSVRVSSHKGCFDSPAYRDLTVVVFIFQLEWRSNNASFGMVASPWFVCGSADYLCSQSNNDTAILGNQRPSKLTKVYTNGLHCSHEQYVSV